MNKRNLNTKGIKTMKNEKIIELILKHSDVKIRSAGNNIDPIEKLIKEIAKKTDYNDHTGSIMDLAIFLKNKKSQKILKAFMDLQDAYGHTPSQIIELRSYELKELIKQTEQNYGKITADKIYSAF
jgi:hypothetical protein